MEPEKKSSNGLLLLFGLIIGFSLTLACTYCLVLRAIEKKNPLIEIDSKFVRQELMIEELRDTANNRYLKYKTKHLEDSVRISALFNQVAIELQYRKRYENMRDSLVKVLATSKAPKYLPK